MNHPESNSSRRKVLEEHQPRMAFDPPRIVGCSCGWRIPAGTTDSDDALAIHVALAMVTA
jgi:hypothetical protein